MEGKITLLKKIRPEKNLQLIDSDEYRCGAKSLPRNIKLNQFHRSMQYCERKSKSIECCWLQRDILKFNSPCRLGVKFSHSQKCLIFDLSGDKRQITPHWHVELLFIDAMNIVTANLYAPSTLTWGNTLLMRLSRMATWSLSSGYLDQAAALPAIPGVCRRHLGSEGDNHLGDLRPQEGVLRHGYQVESRRPLRGGGVADLGKSDTLSNDFIGTWVQNHLSTLHRIQYLSC